MLMGEGWGALFFLIALLVAFVLMAAFAIAIRRGARSRPAAGEWIPVLPLRRRLFHRRVWPDLEHEVREKARRRHLRRHPPRGGEW